MTLHYIRKDIKLKNIAFTKWKNELLGFKVNDQIVTITQHYDNIIQQIKDRHNRVFILSQTFTENTINHLTLKMHLQKWRINKLHLELNEKDTKIKELNTKYLKRALNLKQDRVLLRSIYQWKMYQTMDKAQKAYIKLFLYSQNNKNKYAAIYQFKFNVIQNRWNRENEIKQNQMRILTTKNQQLQLALADIETMQTEISVRDNELQAVTQRVIDYKHKAKETYYSTLIAHSANKRKNKLWKIWKSQYNLILQKTKTIFNFTNTIY